MSAGHYRRENAGTDLTHEFFEKGNVIGEKIRQWEILHHMNYNPTLPLNTVKYIFEYFSDQELCNDLS